MVFLTHAPLLRTPFYWDELGQFVPASLDLFRTGAWVSYTTVPNIHPPGLMAYLSVVWSVTGYSIPATRTAMLLLASAGAFFTFLLAIELGRESEGFPAFTALMLLCVSPLFVAQAMMAQLDMPAMVLTCLSLLLFLKNRIRSAALACVVLVLIKETGIVAPAVFGVCLTYEKRWREALFFAAPLLPLGVWLVVLHNATGHWAGNTAFTQYNAVYNLHPVRFALALLRRLYYLFVGSGHFVGTAAVVYALRHTSVFRSRAWAVVALLAAAHVLVVSAFGGAVLERYLTPLLPLLYSAFAVALAALPFRWMAVAGASLATLLIAANFINPLYPFPLENNLAFTTFVSLEQKAADLIENSEPGALVATMFPMAGALRGPDFGYVNNPVSVRDLDDFSVGSLRGLSKLRKDQPDVLVVYSTVWDPMHLLTTKTVGGLLATFYGYKPQASEEEIESLLGMRRVARWDQGGQWIAVYQR